MERGFLGFLPYFTQSLVPCPWILGVTTGSLKQIPLSAEASSGGFCYLGPKKVLINATAVESFLEWLSRHGLCLMPPH